jgi:tetratricopeptide (TPR) repeat protein
VRITVQLIDAANDRDLWAETYEREVGDILRLQREVAQRIASEIRVNLTPLESDQLALARRVDPDVLRLYLEARYYASQLRTEAIEKSAVLYQQAIEKGPEFAPAHAGLALSHISLCGRRLAPRQTMPRAKASALRALQLDDGLPEAHAALGWVSLQYDWDWGAAEWHIEQAIRLNPGLPSTHQLRALYYGTRGEHDRAISEALLALELDPLSLFAQSHVQFTYFVARDFQNAARAGRSILEREPKFAAGHLMTAIALERLGRGREAMDHFRTAAELDRDGYLGMSLARGYAVLGPRHEAYRILEKMATLAKTTYICAYEVASAYAALGEADKAFEWFRRAVQDRSECLVWAKISPALDPVRSDPRFELLLRQAGFRL